MNASRYFCVLFAVKTLSIIIIECFWNKKKECYIHAQFGNKCEPVQKQTYNPQKTSMKLLLVHINIKEFFKKGML